MKTTVLLITVAVLTGCVSAPQVEKGKGSIFGRVDARPHKEFLTKIENDPRSQYRKNQGKEGIEFAPDMVNYDQLDEVYVGLIAPNRTERATHSITVSTGGSSRRSVMLAPGDQIAIKNNSTKILNFYLVDIGSDDFEEFAPVAPDQTSNFPINMEGQLELGADENDSLIVSILSVKNLVSQRTRSGGSYAFTGITAGNYQVLFWFWRLGRLEHSVVVKAGVNQRLDETLAVDRIAR